MGKSSSQKKTKPKPAAKPAPKPSAKRPAPAPAKPAAKTPAPAKSKPVPAAKAPAPSANSKLDASKGKAAKPAAAPAKGATAPAAAGVSKKPAPKGITIVTPKPVRKNKPKVKLTMPVSEPLLKPGAKWKPLIPSGPKAPVTAAGMGAYAAPNSTAVKPNSKAKLPKKELDKWRQVLLHKRAELVGDISNMEEEALRQNSGSLSSLPQHMAEQGSDASDQSLSLDLAAVDRSLIREIDEALKRIEAGTYGICEHSGVPISAERLTELPWARYSIEAAREMERRKYLA